MRKFLYFVSLSIAVAAAFPCLGHGAALKREFSLPEAMQLAMEHSPVLARARAAIRQQMGVEIEAKAALLPTLDGRAQYNSRDKGLVEAFGPEATPIEQSWLADISISYEIYNGGGRLAGVRAAAATRKAAEDQMRAAVNDVLLQVAKSYFDALLARDRIVVQEEAQQVLGEQLETAKRRFEAGTGQQFAVLQAEVSLANAKPSLINARSAYKLAIERLRTTAGVDYPEGMDGSGVVLTSSWPNNNQTPSLDAALSSAVIKRPELAAVQANIEKAMQQLAGEIALTKPQLKATAGYGLQSRSFSEDIYEDPLLGWTAGVELRIPIIDLGQSRGRRLQAEAVVETAISDARESELTVQAEVRESWLGVSEAREILDTSALVVKQAEEALRLSRAGFDAGAGTQLDVLESRLALTQARLTEIQALHQFHSAVASLRRASGEAP